MSIGGLNQGIYGIPPTPKTSAQIALVTSATPGIGNPIKFDTILYDPAHCYNPQTGLFTCPSGDLVRITVIITAATATSLTPYIVKNGVSTGLGFLYTATSNGATVSASMETFCNARDTLGVYVNTGSVITGSASPYQTQVSFAQV